MEFLEFLLQKEGDRSWLPLDSPEAEILEGRYRLMARCDRGDAPVQIRITYLDLDAMPPRRRTHQVTRTTTAQGVLAVMPFTSLKAGAWTFRCTAPVSGNAKPAWSYKLQLQVLEENANHEIDFEPDFDPAAIRETDSTSSSAAASSPAAATPSAIVSPNMAASPTASQLEPAATSSHPTPTNRAADHAADSLASTENRETSLDTNPDLSSEANQAIASPLASEASIGAAANEADIDRSQEELDQEELDKDSAESPYPQEDSAPSKAHAGMNGGPELLGTSEEKPPAESDLPPEWNNLPPEMQRDMAQMFRAVDDMAADILASMSQRLEGIFPPAAASPPHPETTQPPSPNSPQPTSISPSSLPLSQSSPHDSPAVENAQVDSPEPISNSSKTNCEISSSKVSEANRSKSPTATSSSGRSPNPANPALPLPSLEVRLAQDTFSVQRNTPLVVCGQVYVVPSSPSKEDDDLGSEAEAFSLDTLMVVRLTDPQTGRVQAETQQRLDLATVRSAPIDFSATLTLSPTLQTHVLLGEVILSLDDADESGLAELEAAQTGAMSEATSGQPFSLILASHAFVVTFELDALLGAIAHPSDTLESVDPPLAFVEPSEEPALPTSTEQLPPRPMRVNDQPSLPPQLHEPAISPASGDRPPLDLPSFVKSSTTIAPDLLGLAGLAHLFTGASGTTSEASDVESSTDSTLLDSQGETADPASAEPPSKQPPTQSLPPASPAENLRRPDSGASIGSKQEQASSATAAPLTQNREDVLNPFLDALQELETSPSVISSVANSTERSPINGDRPRITPQSPGAFSESASKPQVDSTDSFDPFALEPADLDAIAAVPESAPLSSMISAQEIVLDSDVQRDHHCSFNPVSSPESASSSIQSAAIADDEAIPVPQLDIVEDELVAGQPVRVSVKLPELPIQVFVKLWVQDRQTRALLDGPRWVADFVSDGAGYAESRTHFTAPLGCVEMRIEAIAVDVLSQRESHKTSLDRAVIPPDLPALSDDDIG